MRNKLDWNNIVPFASAAVCLAAFAALTGGQILTGYNLSILLDQAILLIIGCCGTIFVTAQGRVDLSVGVNLAMSAVVGSIVYAKTESLPLMILATLGVGVAIGLLDGVVVGIFKVPSFMATLALLIGLRGVVNFIQSKVGLSYAPSALLKLNNPAVGIPVLVGIVLVMGYLFEFTRFGRYCKAMGENETVAQYAGVPVLRMKLLAYALSGLTAAVASIFLMARLGGTSATMGSFYEIKIMLSIYVGGVLVSGGTSAKLFKAIVGTFVIIIIENGLVLMGHSSSQVSEAVQGVLLMLILFLTNLLDRRSLKAKS